MITAIIPCYNKVEGVIAVIEEALTSDKYKEIVLLDLRSPDPRTRVYIASIAELYDDRIKVIDPGRKIGLTDGLDLINKYTNGGEYVVLHDYKKDETRIQEPITPPVVQKATVNPYAFKKDTKRDKRTFAPGRFKGGNTFG